MDELQQRSLPGQEIQSFFTQEERILSDVAGASGFSFRKGDQWAINADTGEATYDPRFFEEKGYTPSQALFAAFHEIKSHLVETAELLDQEGGERAHSRLKQRIKKRRWLHTWENWRTDVKGNLAIIQFAPSLTKDIEALYREKLWPSSDFRDEPKHLQFIDTVLRESMLPDEETTIDPMVREAIESLKNIKGKDIISLVTDPSLDPLRALRLSERYIEPVIEKLYQEDLKDKKEKPSVGGDSVEGDSTGEPFDVDYQEHEDKHPEPIDEEEVAKKITEFKESQSEAKRQEAGYQQEHGVSKKDTADYFQEYRQVEQYIEPLREIFRRIVEQRKTLIRRLVSNKDEGVMIDPGQMAQTYLDAKSGIENPKTMQDFEGQIIDENIPGKFSVRVVADQSSSMAGEKAVIQRRSAILVMEALREFADDLDSCDLDPRVGLDVTTELRGFGVDGTQLYKPLSRELTEKQRIDFFKGLLDTSGNITNDYDALTEIDKDIRSKIAQDPVYETELKSGKRREIVIVLSDGDSSHVAEAQRHLINLRNMAIKVIGVGMTPDAQGILTTYAPDAQVCYDISKMPKTMQDLLSQYLDSLSINP